MKDRLLVYTESISPPYDEGYKNFAYHLLAEAGRLPHVLRIGCGDSGVIDEQVAPSKLLASAALRKAVRGFEPDVIVYLPVSSITPASFVRSRMLKRHGGGVPVAMVGLQPRRTGSISRLFAPDTVFVQSEAGRASLEKAGIKAGIVRAGVDSERFRPADKNEKAVLREKYGIPADACVALHVGHINERRNLRIFAGLEGVLPVIIGSSSTDTDRSLALWLKEQGVIVIDGFVESVEEIYRLSDVYVFPVQDYAAAVEMPLSVLEAMSCNLPVVTTKFGGLRDAFDEGDGLFYVDNAGQIREKSAEIIKGVEANTRSRVKEYSWSGIFEKFFGEVLGMAE